MFHKDALYRPSCGACVRGESEARRGASAGRSGAHRPVLVAHEAGGSCSLAGKIARAQEASMALLPGSLLPPPFEISPAIGRQHGHHGDCQVLQAVGAVRRVPRVALLRVRHASRAASTALGVAVCAQWAPLYTSLVFAQWREEGGGKSRGRCLRPFSGDGWFHSLLTVWRGTVDFVQTSPRGGPKAGFKRETPLLFYSTLAKHKNYPTSYSAWYCG